VKLALIACAAAALAAAPAVAQKTAYQGITECAHRAAAQFKQRDLAFRRFVIDRSSVKEDRFAGRVGNQYVSTVYYGSGTYEAASGPKTVRFICLHAGMAKGPVFIYALPD